MLAALTVREDRTEIYVRTSYGQWLQPEQMNYLCLSK